MCCHILNDGHRVCSSRASGTDCRLRAAATYLGPNGGWLGNLRGRKAVRRHPSSEPTITRIGPSIGRLPELRSHPSPAFATRGDRVRSYLSVRTPALVFSADIQEVIYRGSGSHATFKWTAERHVSSPNQSWSQRCWLFVSASGKRCIPSTQFCLTVDSCAAYRFSHTAALRVQVRLGNIGFATLVEKIQGLEQTDEP